MEQNQEQDPFILGGKKTETVMRKARLRSTLKTIAIIVIVTPVILAVIWYGLYHLRMNQGDRYNLKFSGKTRSVHPMCTSATSH